jgi:hypothetical protein
MRAVKYKQLVGYMEQLIGKRVKVVFNDGEEVRSLKGVLVSVTDFLEIRTRVNSVFVAKKEVIKVVEEEE